MDNEASDTLVVHLLDGKGKVFILKGFPSFRDVSEHFHGPSSHCVILAVKVLGIVIQLIKEFIDIQITADLESAVRELDKAVFFFFIFIPDIPYQLFQKVFP